MYWRYQIPEPEPGQLWFRLINLIHCPIVDNKVNFITCSLTWKMVWKSGRVRTQRTTHVTQLILVDPVDDEDLKRSSTNWSFFSKWFWNWLRILVLKRIDFSSTLSRLLCSAPWFSVSARSIDRDSFWFRSGLCVRCRIEYRIESRISTYLLNMNLNKGRD